jgi:hypothetical protein
MAIFTLPIARVGDSNFRVGSGFKMYFYDAGTTNPRNTFTDNTYGTPLSNPVIANASGYFPAIWTTGDYKVRLETADDVLIWEVDNYTNDSGSTIFAEGVLSAPDSTANAITANLPTAPAFPYVDQLQVVVELQHGANTITNPTFSLNGNTAKPIKRDDVKFLFNGDTGGSGYKIYLSYSESNDVWMILNPVNTNRFGMGLDWKNGLQITNNTSDLEHDIDVSAGSIMDSTNTIRMNISAITKQIDSTFAVGNNLGGLSSLDSLGNNTWYGLFAITKADGNGDVIYATTAARALGDAVATAAGFIYERLIGYVLTDDSANILRFWANGEREYLWHVLQTEEFNPPSATGALATVGCPPFQVALTGGRGRTTSSSTRFVRFTAVHQPNDAPTGDNSDLAVRADGTETDRADAKISLLVDGSSRIRYRIDNAADSRVRVNTWGWRMDYSVLDLV